MKVPQLWQKWQTMRAQVAGLLSSRPQGMLSRGGRAAAVLRVMYRSSACGTRAVRGARVAAVGRGRGELGFSLSSGWQGSWCWRPQDAALALPLPLCAACSPPAPAGAPSQPRLQQINLHLSCPCPLPAHCSPHQWLGPRSGRRQPGGPTRHTRPGLPSQICKTQRASPSRRSSEGRLPGPACCPCTCRCTPATASGCAPAPAPTYAGGRREQARVVSWWQAG